MNFEHTESCMEYPGDATIWFTLPAPMAKYELGDVVQIATEQYSGPVRISYINANDKGGLRIGGTPYSNTDYIWGDK